MLPVNGLYSKQNQNQSDKPNRVKQKISILFKAQKSVYENNMKIGFLAFVYPTANMFA